MAAPQKKPESEVAQEDAKKAFEHSVAVTSIRHNVGITGNRAPDRTRIKTELLGSCLGK